MKMAFANNYLYLRGGSERVMFDEIEGLRESGHEVNLFGRLDPAHPTPLPNSNLCPSLVPTDQIKGFQKLKAAFNIIYNSSTSRAFTEFCSRTHPDICHAHNIYAGLTTAILDVCKARAIPSVITLHDYKLACPSYLMLDHGRTCERCVGGRFYNCVRHACHKASRSISLVSTLEAYYNELFGKYLQADYLITPSAFLLSKMLDHGISSKKLLCIPNGLTPSMVEPVSDDQGYVLYLGRLSPEKGIGTLVSALAGTKIVARIVGEGPELSQLKAQVGKSDAGQVIWEGYQHGTALRDLMRGAMFVVVPSEWYENASMTVLEAMAYGKPVIASRIGGIPEQVVDGETGILYTPGHISQLRHAIQMLTLNKRLRVAMGKAGRARLESRFSLNRHCQALLKVYQSAIRKESLSQTDLN